MFNLRSNEFRIDTVNVFRSIIIVVNPLIWYSAVIFFLQNTLSQLSSNSILTGNDVILVWSIHFLGIVFAALVGSVLTKKVEKNRFLMIWMLLGTISSMTLFVISATTSLAALALIVLFLGVSLGLGMPACMEYYTASIQIEKRGRISGLIMLLSGIGVLVITTLSPASAITLGIILAAWRLSSLLFFYSFRKFKTANSDVREAPSYKLILSQESFILYFIPWAMFGLVNYLSGSAQIEILGTAAVAGITTIQSIFTAIFAVIGGFLLDLVGRKRIAISGFIFLGIDSATLGLFPVEMWANYFGAILNGVAWGLLLSTFILTIWGDLSPNANSAKYYAIGVTPFFVSKLLELTIGGTLSSLILKNAGQNGFFSFLAFFLFIAVLPLIYAPETLPEKTLKSRDLKSYAEKALKQATKEADKRQRKNADNAEVAGKEKEEKTEQTPEYDEARKLAEKYY